MSVLTVSSLSVKYTAGDIRSLGLKEYVIKRLRGDILVREFYANRDISFSIDRGDMLGIIGKNGAGKSTLLKAISGIIKPSAGEVSVRGRVAALLELASGFDGELTVRENTYLRGALLGYTRKFMDESYGEIIDFAELGGVEDRPFKHLSSGMRSRLAFSIASHVSPDLLILDEVLSVGDGAFRKKSRDKMREIMASGVATVLVSHSLSEIRKSCNKILWLDGGNQIAFGDNASEICDRYEKFLEDGKK